MAVAALAERQHGVVSRSQLLALGLSEAMVRHATVSGRLHLIFRGVYGVGHLGIGNSGRMLAAVLACGRGSVVSHGTAAVLLGLWDRQPRLVDVIAPVQAGRKIPEIRRRHVLPPRPSEAWVHDAVPCTSPSRTIIDIAGIVGDARLRRTVEEAAIHHMLNVPEIDAILAGSRRRGTPRLLAILEGWRRYDSAIRLRSPLEARLLPLLSQHGIPIPACNEKLRLGDEIIEVDFLWRFHGLVVEADGRRYHDNPEAEVRDHRRSCTLRAAGYRIWRLRWEDLELRPQRTMAELVRRLHAR